MYNIYNKRLTDLMSGFSQEYCTAPMALNAFTYCDSTSDSTNTVQGIRRIKLIKIIQTNRILQPVLARLGKHGKLQMMYYLDVMPSQKCVLKNSIINSRKKPFILVACHLAKKPSYYIYGEPTIRWLFGKMLIRQ